MFGYVLRRLVLAVPLLLGITFVSFLVIHLAPGDPALCGSADMPLTYDPEVCVKLRDMYKLDRPLHEQYWNWLNHLARLDFGRSFGPHARPVLSMILERLPITLLLNVV